MELVQDLGEMFSVHMHIDFRGGDALVSQHLLYGPEIGPVFQYLEIAATPTQIATLQTIMQNMGS